MPCCILSTARKFWATWDVIFATLLNIGAKVFPCPTSQSERPLAFRKFPPFWSSSLDPSSCNKIGSGGYASVGKVLVVWRGWRSLLWLVFVTLLQDRPYIYPLSIHGNDFRNFVWRFVAYFTVVALLIKIFARRQVSLRQILVTVQRCLFVPQSQHKIYTVARLTGNLYKWNALSL